MKKILLKKLKQDFKKAGFDITAICFILNYIDKTMTTDATQTNGKNIIKKEPLQEESLFIESLASEVKKRLTYDSLDIIKLECNLITFDVDAHLFYNVGGEKEKTTIRV